MKSCIDYRHFCASSFPPLLHLSVRFIPGFVVFFVPVFGRCYLFACSLHLHSSIQLIQQIILLLCPNPLYEYTSMYISILLLIGIWLVSSVGLLWIKPLWILYIGYKSTWALRWCRRGKIIEASILSISPECLLWNFSVLYQAMIKRQVLQKRKRGPKISVRRIE